jgi:large subunit ribosomal protein L21e
MVVKSHGPKRRTREKFRKIGRVAINRFFKEFKIGEKVVIDIDSYSQQGVPFRRFQGLSGTIIEKRGKAYIVEIKDGGKTKQIIAKPEHLKTI